jgi:hypothetical protein
MSFLRVTASDKNVRRKLRLLAKSLSQPVLQESVIRKVAWLWHGRMVLRTPKRWTGATRKAWFIQPVQRGKTGASFGYRVVNLSKVMVYLERGTRPHGPRRAKTLFIPLKRRAAEAGARVVMAEVAAARRDRRRPKFRIGRDYVLARRVRGIRPMHIIRDAEPFMRLTLRAGIRQFIEFVIRS